MLFVEGFSFTAEQLQFPPQVPQLNFKVAPRASQMLELEPITALQVVLLGQQCLPSFFDFATKPLLFNFQLLIKQFSLLLKIFCFTLKLNRLCVLFSCPFLLLTMKLIYFTGQFVPYRFPHGLPLRLQGICIQLRPVAVFLLQLFASVRQSLAFLIKCILLPLQPVAFTGDFIIDSVVKTCSFVFEIFTSLLNELLLTFLLGLTLIEFVLTVFEFSRDFALSAAISCDLFGKFTRSLFERRAVSTQLATFGDDFSLTTLQFAKTLLQRFRGGTGLQQDLQSILIRVLCLCSRRQLCSGCRLIRR